MEVWTFIHKETNEIIRFDIRNGDFEFGKEYYFTTSEYSPLWFVRTIDEINLAYSTFVHPQFSISYLRPATDKIILEDYKIEKFTI